MRDYLESKELLLCSVSSNRLGEVVIEVNPPEIVNVLSFLKAAAFQMLVDICAVDYPGREKRFEVVYHLLSLTRNDRVRIKVGLPEESMPTVHTVTHIYESANWYEREIYDLYGIHFEGHPDLRRILTDYDFDQNHFPMRKDFPVYGYQEIACIDSKVFYQPVRLDQEYRDYDFESPWAGPLPGDEKA